MIKWKEKNTHIKNLGFNYNKIINELVYRKTKIIKHTIKVCQVH